MQTRCDRVTDEIIIRGDIVQTVTFNLTLCGLSVCLSAPYYCITYLFHAWVGYVLNIFLQCNLERITVPAGIFLPVFPAYILDNDEVVQDGSYAPAPTNHDWYLLTPPPQPSAMVFVPSFWQPSCYRINNLQKKERFVTIRNFASFPDVFQN